MTEMKQTNQIRSRLKRAELLGGAGALILGMVLGLLHWARATVQLVGYLRPRSTPIRLTRT